MTIWLSTLQPLVSLVVVLVLANVAALAITFAVRVWYQRRNVTVGPVVANCWAVSVGGLSALLFAFTIVTLWTMLAEAKADAAHERNAIALVARDLLPSQIPSLRKYVGDSVAEWPQLCGGEPDARIDALLTQLERVAQPRAPEYAADLYRELGVVEDLRYERWERSRSSVPLELKIALCLVVLAVFGVLAIALPERPGTHAALTVLVALAFGVVFWVITILAYPYCGDYKIGPGQMSALLLGNSL